MIAVGRALFRRDGIKVVAVRQSPQIVCVHCVSVLYGHETLIPLDHWWRLSPSRHMRPILDGEFRPSDKTRFCLLWFCLFFHLFRGEIKSKLDENLQKLFPKGWHFSRTKRKWTAVTNVVQRPTTVFYLQYTSRWLCYSNTLSIQWVHYEAQAHLGRI